MTIEGSSVAGWNWNWLTEPSNPAEIQELWDRLEVLPGRVLKEKPVRWTWKPEGDDRFTTSSCWKLCATNFNVQRPFVMEWNRWVPMKVNLFGWKAEMCRIATSDEPFKRNVVDEIKWCPLCEVEKESSDHIFLSCYVALVLWQFISSWCKVPPVYAFEFRDLLTTHLHLGIPKNKQKAIQSIILIASWCIWKARNMAIFDNKKYRPTTSKKE
ncbi:uncharacterized protein LOC143634074 [Bidens hawaiensis]|uniref:uncharacterized protein LOC143634074 n=1 Tax=Bidens hawaiensis TaxID=980011 RepID=UPI00404AD658